MADDGALFKSEAKCVPHEHRLHFAELVAALHDVPRSKSDLQRATKVDK
jgi:hypothetical protein